MGIETMMAYFCVPHARWFMSTSNIHIDMFTGVLFMSTSKIIMLTYDLNHVACQQNHVSF